MCATALLRRRRELGKREDIARALGGGSGVSFEEGEALGRRASGGRDIYIAYCCKGVTGSIVFDVKSIGTVWLVPRVDAI